MAFYASSPLLADHFLQASRRAQNGSGWEHKAEKIAYLILRERKGLGSHNPRKYPKDFRACHKGSLTCP